jgi:hypothetical protein
MSSLRRFFSLPSMNHSSTVCTVPGPGSRPLKASTSTRTSPSGRGNFAKPVPFETSVMMCDHSGAELATEVTGLIGMALELPIQTPTASAGASGSSGGAT